MADDNDEGAVADPVEDPALSAEDQLAAEAAKFEQEEIEKVTGKPAVPAAKADGKPATPAADDDLLTQYIDKEYGGDRAGFLAQQSSLKEQNTRLESRIQELADQVTRLQTPAEVRDFNKELKAAIESDEDCLQLTADIRQAIADDKRLGEDMVRYSVQKQKVDSEIAKLEGQLINASDGDKRFEISTELVSKRGEAVSLLTQFNGAEREQKMNASNYKILVRERGRAESAVKDAIEDHDRQQVAGKANNDRILRDFNEAFDSAVAGYDIDIETKKGKMAYGLVRGMLSEFLRTLGDTAYGLDSSQMAKHVKKLVKEYADEHGIGAHKTAAPLNPRTPSARPIRTPRGTTHADAAAVLLGVGDGDTKIPAELADNPQFWRDRAARIQAARSRQVGLANRLRG